MPPPRFPERSLPPSGDLSSARGGHGRDGNSDLHPASGKRSEGCDGKSGPLKRNLGILKGWAKKCRVLKVVVVTRRWTKVQVTLF